MDQVALTPVVISGTGIKPGFFSGALVDGFRGGLSGPGLGQVGRETYDRAKAAVAKYDEFYARALRIANKAARDKILRYYHGDPSVAKTPFAEYTDVSYNIREAEGFSPVNYDVFRRGDVENRVGRLEGFVRDFVADVKDAENAYGSLPEPTVIERIVEVPGAAVAGIPTVPLVVAGGAVLAAVAYAIFRPF